ncbi:hypothetical protein SRB5_51660 [Streptomyces sp. RB5]|uniref:Uncharacterized protein n=1 Tax=Streptomyces smaragdinus TaxID=2585196 RepID=A0A7K0CNG0_9ACTN|nr:hypothetical protein [Streptomyces smaragdinus]MQY14989.1 hypothetical protein [Streptomyces smaragdinus]
MPENTTTNAAPPAAPEPLTIVWRTENGDRTRTVTATSPVPGLFVYELPDDMSPNSPYRWRIGHHSGYGVAAAMFEDDAVRGAHRIAGLADWAEQSPAELRDHVDIEELYDRLAQVSCEHPSWA